MTTEEDKKWYVVQIKPNSYGLAYQNLERQGFETFLPKMKITSRKNNKFIEKESYVFSGYIFVSFNPKLAKWNTINSTYGVIKILTFNNKPKEISSYLILALRNRYCFNPIQPKKNNLLKGDFIKINTGPFTEFIAEIENIDKNNRIWVLLEYAGKKQKVNIGNKNTLFFNKF